MKKSQKRAKIRTRIKIVIEKGVDQRNAVVSLVLVPEISVRVVQNQERRRERGKEVEVDRVTDVNVLDPRITIDDVMMTDEEIETETEIVVVVDQKIGKLLIINYQQNEHY